VRRLDPGTIRRGQGSSIWAGVAEGRGSLDRWRSQIYTLTLVDPLEIPADLEEVERPRSGAGPIHQASKRYRARLSTSKNRDGLAANVRWARGLPK